MSARSATKSRRPAGRGKGPMARPAGAKTPATSAATTKPEVAEETESPDRHDIGDEGVTVNTAPPRSTARETGRSPEGADPLRRVMRPRIGGVAPFVPPANRLGRLRQLQRWSRRGFVPLSPGRPKLRHRILPRTVIGISFMLLSFGVGAAFSGAAFYAYYDQRLAENEETVARFVTGFDQQFSDATAALDSMRIDAVTDIRAELSPLASYVDDANGVVGLPATAGPSVWLVETRDEAGRSARGAAFAVLDTADGTAFVTSYNLVMASATAPNPPIELVKEGRRLPAQLWTWDEDHDVAILMVDEDVPPLPLATDDEQIAAVGARVFALSGVGGQGATASPGVLVDQSTSGLQHTAPLGALFAGGPLVTGSGRVVGVATLAYEPYGVGGGAVSFAPDLGALCETVLHCAENIDRTVAIEVAVANPEGAPAPNTEAGEVDAGDVNQDGEVDQSGG